MLQLGAPGDLAPVELSLAYRERKIESRRHDYRLVVKARNRGDEIVSDWAVEVQFPTRLLETHKHYHVVEERSNREVTVMRMSEADHSGPIFPGDERDVLGIDYFLDEERFDARGTSFPMKVAATFYIGPRRVAHAEKTVEKLQNF